MLKDFGLHDAGIFKVLTLASHQADVGHLRRTAQSRRGELVVFVVQIFLFLR
jgi:hypothetical protein